MLNRLSVVGCLALVLGGSTQAQTTQGPLFETFSSWIGDVDGDAVSDYAVSDPFNGAAGNVTIYSGATNSALLVFTAPPGELNFGMSIVPSCDMDRDGVPDIGIAAILPEPAGDEKGIIHVYSSVTAKELAYIKELDAANISPGDVKVLGDLDGNKQVDDTDLLLWLASMADGGTVTDPLQLDLNKDGTIDAQDVLELFDRLGYVSDQQCELAFVDWLNTGGLIVEDPTWPGTWLPGEYQPAQMGFVGCAWCMIKCGKHLKKAADCGEQYRNHIRTVCDPLADQGLYFEYSQCLDDARLNFLPNCLNDIANAAGNCGKCVTKCGPKPSSLN